MAGRQGGDRSWSENGRCAGIACREKKSVDGPSEFFLIEH